MFKFKYFDIDIDIDVGYFDFDSLDYLSILIIIEYLDHSTLLEFSQINKYYRRLSKKRLFSNIPLIPESCIIEFETMDLYHKWFPDENENFNRYMDVMLRNSKYTHSLEISTFSRRFWGDVNHCFQSIHTLVLQIKNIEEQNVYDIVEDLPNISHLKITFFKFNASKKVGSIPNLPDALTSLDVHIVDRIICSPQMFKFLNSHKKLKIFKFNSSKLLDGLLSPYPSLECLHAKINTKATNKLVEILPNLRNLNKITLIYPYFNNNLINKILVLPNLKDHYLQRHLKNSIITNIAPYNINL